MTVSGVKQKAIESFSFFFSLGKIKVNESQMVTSNIPATNGVIHAIDNLL